MFPIFKCVGESSTAKNYCPVSSLFEKEVLQSSFLNTRIVDHLEKCCLFSDFQHGFRSFWSTADLFTIVSDRIAWAFNRPRATWAVALAISKVFDKVWHAGLLHKLTSHGMSGQMFSLISSILTNRRLQMVLNRKSSQNIHLMLEFIKAPFLVLHFCYLTLMTFLMML